MSVKPLVRGRKMSKRAVKAGAPLAVLLVAILLPRLSLLQTILLTPAFISLILVATIGIGLLYAVRREASQSSNELDRQRHALRRFTFTTPSAWSAVLTRQSWEDSPSPSWRTPIRQLSGPTSTARFNALFDLIEANFILPWYARISPSRAFPDAVEILIRQSLSRTIQRGEDIDWPDILVSRIVPLVTDHLHHFRSIEHLASTSARPTSQTHLPLPLPKNPHPALATTSHGHSHGPSPTIEAHLRGLAKRMLKHILPQHEQTEVVGTIASEVVLGTVLMPVFEMLCEGDFWNRQIDEHGGRYLHEQKQVNRFLSALSTLQQPLVPPPPQSQTPSVAPRNLPPASSISIHSSSKHFDSFMKSIHKLKSLGEARRLRADVERELRNIGLVTVDPSNESEIRNKRKYEQRLERARSHIDERIAVLSGETRKPPSIKSPDISSSRLPTGLDLYSVLSDPSSMAYFLEFMERRSRSRLVQFWLTIEGFKDPLEAVGRHSALENTAQSLADDKKLSQSTTIAEDVSFLHQAYFANRKDSDTLDIPVKHQSTIQYFTQLSSDQVTEDIVRQVKVAMFSAQDSVYTQMEEEDWPMFGKSELYRKAVANIERVSSSQAYPVPPPPKRTSTSSTVLPTFPPPPVRQHTAPSLLPSISSPPQRSIPKLINGNFAIPTSKLDPAISMPERSVSGGSTSSGRQTRVSDLREVQSSTPATPSLTRGSSHFDVLMSAGTMKQRNPLFDDNEDEVDDGDSEYIQVQRMEAIQAALNEIIASDDMTASRMSDSQTMSPMLDEMKSPSASVVSLDSRLPANPRKIASRGVDNLKGFDVASPGNSTHGFRHQVIAGRKSLTSLSPTEERPSRVLFDDDPSLAAPAMVEEEEIVESKQDDLIKLAEPGDLKLGTEILRLQTKIQELVKQEHLLETLISQAELTGNQAELRLLHRSQSSIRQETRSCIFQKAQYEQQEEENRLVPGRTRVTIPSHIDTLEEGKQVVRYIVRIEQLDENQEVGLKWDIARRYNDFHDLDKGVRDWASNASDKSAQSEVRKKVAELPSKKLVPVLSGNQLDTRRAGLERYLQSLTSSSILCASPPLQSFFSRRSTSNRPAESSDMSASMMTSASSLAPHNLVRSLYKTMATSLDDAMLGPSMLDIMYTSLSRQLSDVTGLVGVGGEDLMDMLPQALTSGWAKESTKTPNSTLPVQGSVDETAVSIFTAPICDLFVELFDLKENKNNWLRRQAIVVILQQLLGSTIERKVRDTLRGSLQSDSIDKVLLGFQEMLFPDGERRPPSEPRTEAEKHETKIGASKKLGMLIPDVAANMIGRGNARRGARRVFSALQDRRLNQQLILGILDEIFDVLFPATG